MLHSFGGLMGHDLGLGCFSHWNRFSWFTEVKNRKYLGFFGSQDLETKQEPIFRFQYISVRFSVFLGSVRFFGFSCPLLLRGEPWSPSAGVVEEAVNANFMLVYIQTKIRLVGLL
jgi:hypothetical protein